MLGRRSSLPALRSRRRSGVAPLCRAWPASGGSLVDRVGVRVRGWRKGLEKGFGVESASAPREIPIENATERLGFPSRENAMHPCSVEPA